MKKLGANAYPFLFELPPHYPASVTLQPAPGDTGKPCGIDCEMKAYVGDTVEDKPHKRNSVRLAIRKVMYAPSKPGDQPSVEVSKEFMMSPKGRLFLSMFIFRTTPTRQSRRSSSQFASLLTFACFPQLSTNVQWMKRSLRMGFPLALALLSAKSMS